MRRKVFDGVFRTNEGKIIKMHLIDEGETGILVINANKIVYTNETGKEHIKQVLKGKELDEAVKALKRKYKVDPQRIKENHEKLLLMLNVVSKTDRISPITFYGVETIEPLTKTISHPLRMDLALTYRCNNNCIHCYAGGPHKTKELSTKQWKRVIKKIYSLGTPQIVFTGGEPTLREDLPLLIEYTQRIGAVAGLITNGRKFKDENYVADLVAKGLDYAQITIESHDPRIHDKITGVNGSWSETVEGIRNALKQNFFVSTNTTLSRFTVNHVEEIIDFLDGLGIRNFGMNALIYSGRAKDAEKHFALSPKELRTALEKAKREAEEREMNFIWYLPTKYCELNPVEMGLGVKFCSAVKINMLIEPDGTVLPCQSWFKSLGNILRDKWSKIAKHPIYKYAREWGWMPKECRTCSWSQICSYGCPLESGICEHCRRE